MSAKPVPITISLLPKAHQRLFELAKAKGYRPSEYAQLLFDAAFAARVGQERGIPASDAELDEQVRLVFACAGQGSTAAIAKATGLPEARVTRVLDGLRELRRRSGGRGGAA
ncbi:hypothetical protein [Chelativorans sp.]|uniref:hypothetical protein n=1 Tax=Chelativorans sp. TaxID=2203393 RepID=UPI0028117F74|nr:hypothetical protein [Chelativorans sp.]